MGVNKIVSVFFIVVSKGYFRGNIYYKLYIWFYILKE